VIEVKQIDVGFLQRNITALNVTDDESNGCNTDNDDINDLFNNSVSLKHTKVEALVAQRLIKRNANTNNRLTNTVNE
jgi:hypothetical protein